MENFKEAMQLFVSDDDIRPLMMQAFKLGNNQYATDAHALIKIPLSVIDLQLPEQDKPNCDAIIPIDEIEREIIVSNILYGVEVEMTDEEIEKEQECSECGGEGEVEYEYSASRQTFFHEAECPICDGTGVAVESIKTGKMIPDENQRIKLGAPTFSRFQLERLIKACELLGYEKIIQTKEALRGPNTFRLGEITILVMPLSPNN